MKLFNWILFFRINLVLIEILDGLNIAYIFGITLF